MTHQRNVNGAAGGWPALRRRFETDGFVVVEDWLTAAEVDALRHDADALAARGASDALRRGCVFETTPARAHCTSVHDFLRLRHAAAPDVLFGGKLAHAAACLLDGGDEVRLFNEQYIVKPAHGAAATAFAWHRDGQWLQGGAWGGEPRPYLSLWCALDDVHEENGTLCVLPGTHVAAAASELVLPPVTADVPPGGRIITALAGSLVALHHAVLHCSMRNLSDSPRRAWMPQLSRGPVVTVDGQLARHAVPCTL